MYNKNEYSLSIFLLSKESGRRLMSALLEAGFSVDSGLKNEKIYTDGHGSIACSLIIYTVKSLDETEANMLTILKQEQIYYFGYVLIDFRNNRSKINGGFLPKKDETITNGPYR
jgi:hypothetical protein